MTIIEEIIHRDDWKRTGWRNYYTEEEVKVMIRKYAEECIEEMWKDLSNYIDEDWSRAYNDYNYILKEIQNQVMI